MSAWSHLPNAKHIDAAIVAAKDPALGAAQDAAWDAARSVARGAALCAALCAARDAALCAARDAIRVLIAWDESAELLSLHPDAVEMIATIGEGVRKHQAVLMYPYVVYLWRGRK